MDGTFRLGFDLAKELASRYGTPLYVLSETCLRERMREYRTAFAAAYEDTELCYASKANSNLTVLRIANEEGLFIDVASEGELRAALLAGVEGSQCDFHGNNKSEQELVFALSNGIRTIIADNFEELEVLGRLWCPEFKTRILLRLAPGVDPQTHEKISTGQEDSKFGFNVSDGAAEQALLKATAKGLPVVGFHCHVGSQLLDARAQTDGGEVLARFAVEMLTKNGFEAKVINFGGGLGIQYSPNEQPPSFSSYSETLVSAVRESLSGTRLQPTLLQEPGRAIVGPCGVTLYTVGVVKTVPTLDGPKLYVVVDGGMADNPRPALYSAQFEVGLARQSDSSMVLCTVAGRHCETDELFPNVELPRDVGRGDLVQVLATGAYNASMASNYNRYPRPATVLLRENGTHSLVQRRESWQDIFGTESMPEDL